MRQLVDEMHSKGVFYQDINPDNIVIENSAERLAHLHVKYIDFGRGVIFTPEAVTQRNGRSSASLFTCSCLPTRLVSTLISYH